MRGRGALGTVLVLAGAVLGGCASLQGDRLADADALPEDEINLEAVPFHPQKRYQCGPAALATALGWSGVDTDPDALVPEVYLPARKGSLQPEITATARRHERIPYRLAPRMADLFRELEAGHPVLILQNLGFGPFPVWHYAVVVGYDPDDERILLRSGEDREVRQRRTTFERTWRRADYWGIVILPAGRVPATAEPTRYLEAVLALDPSRQPQTLLEALETARRHWPEEPAVHLALGEFHYEREDPRRAAQALRTGIDRHPRNAALHLNLAVALLAQDELAAADTAAQRAQALGGRWAERADTTRERIRMRLEEQAAPR